MDASELQALLKLGETSTVQFKRDLRNETSLAQELVAFSNGPGGRLIVGIDDKTGQPLGLNYADLQRINQLVSNAASNQVKEPVYPLTEVVEVEEKLLMVIQVEAGTSKPYLDKDGIIWVKSGADKRKVTSAEEISRLLQSGQRYLADKQPVPDAGLEAMDEAYFVAFFEKQYGQHPDETGLSRAQLLENLYLAKGGQLNLGGLLLFGKAPEKFFPALIIKAVAFKGTELAGNQYYDSEDIGGKLAEQFQLGMAFFKRNLQKVQNGQSFNSLGEWEVPQGALEEILQNALVHRDFFKNAPIRLFIFDDRLEIISPGTLPNSLTVENIRYGNTAIRNNVLVSFATKILPYRGLGSGIPRALKAVPDLQLINDTQSTQFRVVFPRPHQ